MYPPTPTPLPPGVAQFEIPSGAYSLWEGAPYAIQSWHMLGTPTTYVIQGILLVVAIIVGMVLVFRFFQLFIRRDAES